MLKRLPKAPLLVWQRSCLHWQLSAPLPCARSQCKGEEQLKTGNLESHTSYEIPRGPLLTPPEHRAAVFGVKDAYNIYHTFLVEADFFETVP